MNDENPLWPCVVINLEGQRYALHLSQVERVVHMVAVSRLPKAPAIALGVINYHGSVVPVLDVRQRFGLPPHVAGLDGHLLLARTTRRLLALPVNEVLGVTEVPAAQVLPPSTLLPSVGYVNGIVALPDGLLFIHDLESLLSLDEEQQLTKAIDDNREVVP